MKIILESGEKLNIKAPLTIAEIAEEVQNGLEKIAVCGEVNGKFVDLSHLVEDDDACVRIFTMKDEVALKVYRNTCAQVLAQALKSIFPTCLIASAMPTASGFYCDVDFKNPISADDFSLIESEMKKIIKSDLPIERFELKRKDAVKLMKGFHESYKVALIESFPPETSVSFYKQGAFTDMSKGPHLPSTGKIKSFALYSVAGAYWRGNENNKMLTRIYGIAFARKSQLDGYIKKLEDAKKRDHNKLGRELELFLSDESVGQGLPVILPKGSVIMREIIRFVEDEELKAGVMPVRSPVIAKSSLYTDLRALPLKKGRVFGLSGKNKEEGAILRPSTCPFHYIVFKNGIKSYRDLPCRYGETAALFRNEASGELHGLTRIRQFTVSDGHSILLPAQAESEFEFGLSLSIKVLNALGLGGDVAYRLLTRGAIAEEAKKKYRGTDDDWITAENAIRSVTEKLGLSVYEDEGAAVSCGPCLELQFKNVFGKEDRLLSFQFDFGDGVDYNLYYYDENGAKRVPWVMHRSVIGCYERILAILIEKYSGAFPVWLAPVQVAVLSVSSRHAGDCEKLAQRLSAFGLRVTADLRAEKIGKKIRDCQLKKIPYALVAGDNEADGNFVSVRRLGGARQRMATEEFLQLVLRENAMKMQF